MLRSKEEVERNMESASQMELAVATGEMLTAAIRGAVDMGDRRALLLALRTLKGNTEMLLQWVEEMKN